MLQRFIEYGFYALFFLIPLFWTSITSEVFELNKMLGTYVLTTLIAGAWAIKSILSGRIIFRRSLLDIPLLLFLLSQVVSTYFSIDQHLSIWGYYSRLNGGLVSTISYCLLYWAYVSNMTYKNTLFSIRYILFSASIVAGWAILEHFDHSPSCIFLRGEFNVDCWVQKVQERPFATLGQPNWLASYLVAIAPLGWVFSVISNKTKVTRRVNIVNIVTCYMLPVTILLAIIFTQSRAGLYGYLVAYIIFWSGIFLIGKNIKHLLHKFLLVTCYLLLVTLIFGTRLTPSISDTFHNISNQSPMPYTLDPRPSPGGTESGDIRKIVWKGAVNIWKTYPLVGSGPETFSQTYYQFRPLEHNQTSEWDLLYNKAHNEFLNYLANTGIFGSGSYLLLIVFSILQILKMTKGKWSIAFLAGFLSLQVTHFFGFSVSVTNTLLFLYPAMAIVVTSNKRQVTSYVKKLTIIRFITLVITIIVTCYLLLITISYWYADYHYNQAGKLMTKNFYTQSLKHIQSAVNTRPDEPLYSDKLAQIISYMSLKEKENDNPSDGGNQAKELATLSEQASDVALSISPGNLNLLKSQAVIMNRLSQIDTTYLSKAVEPLEKAIELAPTDPEVHYNLGAIYSSLDKNEKALEVLQKSVGLKPDYYDARVGLGQVYTKLGQKEQAREQYQWVLDYLNPDDEEIKAALEQLQKTGTR